jgi:hypothetical protein
MKHLPLTAAAVLAAGGLALVPAMLGLAGNDSFSQRLPVRAPAHASLVVDSSAAPSPAVIRANSPQRPEAPRSDDRREREPGDDRGGDRFRADDHPRPEDRADDRGRGRHGGDDG